MSTREMALQGVILAAFVVAILAAGSACSLLPELRVGQKKVDGKLAEKPAEQTEAERTAAKFIEIKSAVPEADMTEQIAAIHAVAVPLSASLGEPNKPVTLADQQAVIDRLQKGILAAQKNADAWKAFAKKYNGTELEGTGVNLAGVGGVSGLLLIIAACIFVPGFGTLVLFVIRRLRGTVQTMAQSVEAYAAENPEAAKELKAKFSAAMDKAHKRIVAREKKFIDWTKVKTPQPA